MEHLEQAGDEEAILHVAVRRISKEDLGETYDTKGRVTGTNKRASVFALLSQGRAPALSRNQAAHGHAVLELYARCQGIAGSAEYEDAGFIDGGKPSNDELVMSGAVRARKRIEHRDEWSAIMAYVGPPSARLLDALCRDYWEGDGMVVLDRNGKLVARWRNALAGLGIIDRDRQSERVVVACEALGDYAEERRRSRRTRAA